MSIFGAEIRKKVVFSEDSLAAKFFGLLELLPPEIGLRPFLSSIGMPEEKGRKWRMFLWPYFKSREPDVVFEANDAVVIVEVKFGSPLDSRQLIDEYEEGREEYKGRALRLVALTHEVNEPQAMDTARSFLDKKYGQGCVRWISWNDMYPLLRRARQTGGVAKAEKELISGMLKVFKRYGIRGFDMFDHPYVSTGGAIAFVGEFLLFAREVGKRVSLQIGEYPWKDINAYAEDFDLPTLGGYLYPDIRVHFFDKAWGEDCHRCLYLSCPVHERQPRIRCGYWMAFFNDCRLLHLGLIKENWESVVDGFGGIEGVKAELWGPHAPLPLVKDRYDEAESERHRAINFQIELWKSEGDELPPKELVEVAVSRLTQLKDVVNEIGLAKTSEQKKAFLNVLRKSQGPQWSGEDEISG